MPLEVKTIDTSAMAQTYFDGISFAKMRGCARIIERGIKFAAPSSTSSGGTMQSGNLRASIRTQETLLPGFALSFKIGSLKAQMSGKADATKYAVYVHEGRGPVEAHNPAYPLRFMVSNTSKFSTISFPSAYRETYHKSSLEEYGNFQRGQGRLFSAKFLAKAMGFHWVSKVRVGPAAANPFITHGLMIAKPEIAVYLHHEGK
jgi:hypothetical protein